MKGLESGRSRYIIRVMTLRQATEEINLALVRAARRRTACYAGGFGPEVRELVRLAGSNIVHDQLGEERS